MADAMVVYSNKRIQEVVKQISNAVPPMLLQAIYWAVIKSLRKMDKAELRAAHEQGQGQAGVHRMSSFGKIADKTMLGRGVI
jgi:hypothetical protein